MSFHWNPASQGRHFEDRTPSIPHWMNSEQYTQSPRNIPSNHYTFQDTGVSSGNWNNSNIQYHHQWCSPTSQEQMKWPCPSTSFPQNQYNQVLPNNFTSNVYNPNFSPQNKSSYGENFTGLYNQPERSNNNNFNYQMTNSFMSSQGSSYGIQPQNNFVNNCLDSSKMCGGNTDTNNRFSYWNSEATNRNETDVMNYEQQPPMYNVNACNVALSNVAMKSPNIRLNCMQNEAMQKFKAKTEQAIHHQQISKQEVPNTGFPISSSSSSSSNFFMDLITDESVSSSLPPIHSDEKNQNFFDSFCSMNAPEIVTSSSAPVVKYNDSNSTGEFGSGNDLKNQVEMTSLPKRDEFRENVLHLQNKIFAIEKQLVEKSLEFEKVMNLFQGTNHESSYQEFHRLNMEIKSLECELDNVEIEIKLNIKGHNVPSYIDLNERGLKIQQNYGSSDRNEYELLGKNVSVKSLRQNLFKLKEQLSGQLDIKPEVNQFPESSLMKSQIRNEEHIDTTGNAKTSSVKQVRRVVLKYLLHLSSRIEKCFTELRNVKRKLKDDPSDREIIQILHKVGLQINHFRLSLKEKKKLCAKSNIRLRSLTIKATGTNILQTLENDMYHLKRFYTALSQIARHLGTIKKSSSSASALSYDDGDKENPKHLEKDDTRDSFEQNEDLPGESSSQNESCTRDICLNGPPQKSARFMVLERRYWAKLMEASYLIRSKILVLRQAERTYKNGKKEGLARLHALSETPCRSLKKDVKLLIYWKKKYNFSRHLPSYILQGYPEHERNSRDKISLKSVRKNFVTFMSLCYSMRVLISTSQTPNEENMFVKEEAVFWKRLLILFQKSQIHHSELLKLKVALFSDGRDKESLDSVVRLEARIKEIEFEFQKEEINRHKNGYNDSMPSNNEIRKLNLNRSECRNVHVLRDSIQNLKTALSEIKSSQVNRLQNLEVTSTGNSLKPMEMSLAETHMKELPSDLAHFLGDTTSGWI